MFVNVSGRLIRKFYSARTRLRTWMNHKSMQGDCIIGKDALLLENAKIVNGAGKPESIRIGMNSVVLGELAVLTETGLIDLGTNSYIGPGSRIMAFEKIQIGDRVQISHDVNIYDNNSHSISASKRFAHMQSILRSGHPKSVDNVPSAPVVIEDDAWIGFGSIILKGVRIGKGAVIGAGSVITKDVPPFKVVVGSPQREIGDSQP